MVCSFTGHRVIPQEHTKALANLIERAVEYAYSEGCRTFCAGGALGFDTMAARAVLLFKLSHPDIRLHLLLPCVNQDEKWNERQRSDYSYILKNADYIEYSSDEYTKGCMRERNYKLAECCDILICYVCKSGSGAAQTVRFAEKMEKRIYNLYSAASGTAKNARSESL